MKYGSLNLLNGEIKKTVYRYSLNTFFVISVTTRLDQRDPAVIPLGGPGIPNEIKFGLVSEVSSKISHREQLLFFFFLNKDL